MGNTFEVWSWERDEYRNYDNRLCYAGEDYEEALNVMKDLKSKGVGYVKLEWR
jgi:hypothetical protein